MNALSSAEMLDLAGGPVASLEDAATAEPVTADDVASAGKLADEAERRAAETEQAAITGTMPEGQAIADRESARFAKLRHALTERRHERYLAAQRLRALEAVGQDALTLAGRLKGLRDATLADLAEIEELRTRIQARIAAWNSELSAIATRGAELGPEPVPPSGAPLPSSAGVWAGTIDRGPRVIVKRRVIKYIDLADPRGDGLPAMIDAAVTETAGATASDRLILTEGGQVQTIGTDRHGIFQRKIDAGLIHELTPRERRDYLAGKPVTWETITHD